MENPNKPTHSGTSPESARNGLADAKATLTDYEGNLVGAMDAQADAWEAKLAKVEAEVEALSLLDLADTLNQAGQQIDEHAHDCRGDDSEWAYRFESAAVLRASKILRTLLDVESEGNR